MIIYQVKSGDTLWDITRRYDVDLQQTIRINNLDSPDRLAVGQAIILPTETHPYVVKAGESVWQIANRTGQTTGQLYGDNPALRTRSLMEGETIFVRTPPVKRGTLEVNGYAYPFIDEKVLADTLPYLTYLTIFSYGVTVTGDLVQPEDEGLLAAAKQAGVAPIMLLSTIGTDGKFNSEAARSVLEDAAKRGKLIQELTEILNQKGYYAIDVDFEYIPETLGGAYADFIEQLRIGAAPHPVFVALAPKSSASQRGLLYEAHDYSALGAAADRGLIMTYEWGYTFGPPMAVAPRNEVRRVMQYATSAIPPEKILMGMPNYAYDWPLPFQRGVTAARSLGNPEAVSLAAAQNSEIIFDPVAASPFFDYNDKGVLHQVWFEDARSVSAKLELVDEFKLRGVGIWNIMRPFGQLWYLLDYYYDIRKIG